MAPSHRKRPKRHSDDVLDSGQEEGMSTQGEDVRGDEPEMAREEAKGRAAMERTVRPKLKNLADGGKVNSEDTDTKKDKPSYADDPDSLAYKVQHAFDSDKPDPKPSNEPKEVQAGFWSDGGEVEMSDEDHMDEAMGEELMNAIHGKDKKGIVSALTAITRSLKNRG